MLLHESMSIVQNANSSPPCGDTTRKKEKKRYRILNKKFKVNTNSINADRFVKGINQ